MARRLIKLVEFEPTVHLDIMKTKLSLKAGIQARGWTIAGATALLVMAAASAVGQKFPIGTWDLVMSGSRQGIAYITFTNDPSSSSNFSFSGFEILVPKKTSSQTPVVGRNDGSSTDRGGSEGTTTFVPGEQLFGYQPVSGPWNYDEKGRVVGYFVEHSVPTSSTNVVTLSTNTFASGSFFPSPLTNGPDSNQVFCVTSSLLTNNIFSFTNQQICYSNAITFQALTNTITFVAKGTYGKRLTMHTSTPFGGVTFRGVPPKPLKDLSGSWQGVKKEGFQNFQEFFTMTPSVTGLTNMYDVKGTGPGYSYTNSAIALVSSQNKIAFACTFDPIAPDEQFVRAVTGPFNFKKVKANTRGWEGSLGTNITFKAFRAGP